MRSFKRVIGLLLSLSVVAVLFSAQANAAPSGNLVWSDEFDGSSLDTSKWVYDVGYGQWGNEELEYYRSGTNNIRVADGNLAITAKKESYGGASYTSGRITTHNKFTFKYGSIEARIKMPNGQGLWPAFWMLSQSASWPNGGEIDIMEHINSENVVYGTGHDWNNGNTKSRGGTSPSLNVTQYHTYRVDWNESTIKWLIDDREYFTLDISQNNGFFPNTNVFHEPYYILLNLAVGGSWPGNPVDSSFPATMYVDYVRVYDNSEPIQNDPPYYVFKMNTSKAYVSFMGASDIGDKCEYYNGKAYLPLRTTAMATACPSVDFADNTIILRNSAGYTYNLMMNSTLVTGTYPSGASFFGNIENAPVYINGKVYLPVRDIATVVGANIQYHELNSNGYVIVCPNGADTSNYMSWLQTAIATF